MPIRLLGIASEHVLKKPTPLKGGPHAHRCRMRVGTARRLRNFGIISGDSRRQIGIPIFPANRENNTEFASFSAIRACRLVNLRSNSSPLPTNSRPDWNTEFPPGKQGFHPSEQGSYRSACWKRSTGDERSAARRPSLDKLIFVVVFAGNCSAKIDTRCRACRDRPPALSRLLPMGGNASRQRGSCHPVPLRPATLGQRGRRRNPAGSEAT
jgi:hypothetical protein